jgi:signal peptidase II
MSARLAAPWYGLAFAVILLDQATKAWISVRFAYGESVALLPVFDLTLLHNTGAAFSLLADQPGWQRWFLVTLALAVSAALAAWLWRLPAEGRRLERWAFALVLGGALGNVIDRVRLGYVVDFLHVHWERWYFPAFNLADSAITIGALCLILDVFTAPAGAPRA